MYRLLYFQIIIVSLLLIAGILSCARLEGGPPQPDSLPGNSPANTSYLIENNWVPLVNSRAEWPAAPNSASKIEVALLGETIYGDLNKDELWLAGDSPALAEVIASYRETMAGFPPYAPVFAILSGRKTDPPAEGFGAEYEETFFVSQLINIWPKGNCKSDLILLASPLPGATISSPLTISGRARGTWFFEGDFPIILEDGQGKNIAVSYATAKGKWMTADFVEFEGIIQYKGSLSGQKGTLILKKDNPAGLDKFDDALEIPINFY